MRPVALSAGVDSLRNPEYTGENRCTPCTALNVGIAAAAAGVVATWSMLAGGAAFVAFAAVIYLRGYLVPGTPWFTRTYFPDWLLRLFDKQPAGDRRTDAPADVESLLYEAGAVTECEDVDDLCLEATFRDAWRTHIAQHQSEDAGRAALASIFGAEEDPPDEDQLSFADGATTFIARHDGAEIGRWESRPAFVADVAAAATLEERYGRWTDLDLASRSAMLSSLRLFLEACPACDAPVSPERETVKSCCLSKDVIAVTCDQCGSRLMEVDAPDDAPA